MVVPALSEHFVLLRRPRGDLLLEVPRRAGFVEELRAVRGDALTVRLDNGVLVARGQVKGELDPEAAAAAFVGTEALLLLPYDQDSILLRGETFFFGFLYHQVPVEAGDVVEALADESADPALPSPITAGSVMGDRDAHGRVRKWERAFGVLKTSPRRLYWMRHPADTTAVGEIDIDGIRVAAACAEDQGAFVLVRSREYGADAFYFKAPGRNSRDDWMTSVRTLQD